MNAGHDLAEQHQPEHRLHRAGQKFERIVNEFLHLGGGDRPSLYQIIADPAGEWFSRAHEGPAGCV